MTQRKIRTASPLVTTVAATKLLPVPVASTWAVTWREPSLPLVYDRVMSARTKNESDGIKIDIRVEVRDRGSESAIGGRGDCRGRVDGARNVGIATGLGCRWALDVAANGGALHAECGRDRSVGVDLGGEGEDEERRDEGLGKHAGLEKDNI